MVTAFENAAISIKKKLERYAMEWYYLHPMTFALISSCLITVYLSNGATTAPSAYLHRQSVALKFKHYARSKMMDKH